MSASSLEQTLLSADAAQAQRRSDLIAAHGGAVEPELQIGGAVEGLALLLQMTLVTDRARYRIGARKQTDEQAADDAHDGEVPGRRSESSLRPRPQSFLFYEQLWKNLFLGFSVACATESRYSWALPRQG